MVHFLVMGATGLAGVAFVETVLEAGHEITVYARNPSKLPPQMQSGEPRLRVVEGSIDDSDAVTRALRTGATVLVSFMGPAMPAKGTLITEFYEKLFPLIRQDKETKIKRLLILSTPSFSVPEDKSSWKWRFAAIFVRLAMGSAYAEVNGIGRVTTSQPLEELEWTVFRVPGLTTEEAKTVSAGYVGFHGDGFSLSRKGMARWLLREVQERKWVGKCPLISDA